MAIDLIDTIKPKNNGTFPMVEAEDVVVGKGTAEEKRLPEALEGKLTEEAADARYLKLTGGNTISGTQIVTGDIRLQSHTLTAGNVVVARPPAAPNNMVRRADFPDWVLAGDGLTAAVSTDEKVTLGLKPATASSLGGVKVGSGLTVEEDGTLSATGTDITIDPSGGLENGANGLGVKTGSPLETENGFVTIRLGESFEGGNHQLDLLSATADRLGGIKVGDGLNITDDGILSATGSGVTIDTTLPDEPTDDHVPSTKLVKDYLLNGKGQINYIYCGNGGFSFMGGESSAFPGAQFDIAPPPPTGEEKFFKMGDASSATGLIPVPTKDYVDEAVAAKQDKLVAGDGLTQTTEASGIRLDLKPATATSLGGVKVAGGNTGVGIDADTGTLRVVGQSDGQGGVWFGNDLFMSYAGGNLQVVIPSGTFELTSKSYVDGLVGDIGAALAAI